MSRAAMQQALAYIEEVDYGPYDKWPVITALRQALAEPEQAPISLNNGRLTQYPDGRIGFGTRESVGAIGHAPTPRKPQTTHWEGCEAVHPECRKPDTDCHAQGICQRSGYSIAPTTRKPQTTHWEGCEAVHPECKAKAITADEMGAWVKDTWEKCQAEAWQEPVAYCTLEQLAALKLTVPSSDKIPLYTAPTPRKPQTTHWEGCEAVHPECRKPDTDCHAQGICQRSGYSIANTQRRPLTDAEIERIYTEETGSFIDDSPWALADFVRAIERAHGIAGEGAA